MAKKIIGGIGSLLGIGGKKKSAATPTTTPADAKGPKVTLLSADEAARADPRRPKRPPTVGLYGAPTILADKLG